MQVDLLNDDHMLTFRVTSTRDVQRHVSLLPGFNIQNLDEDPEFTVSREVDNIEIQDWYNEAQEFAVSTGVSLYMEALYRGAGTDEAQVFLPEGLTKSVFDVTVSHATLEDTNDDSLSLFLDMCKVYL